jgi:hypothetical protein
MKWKPKNDTCGVPGKGFIKAESFSQEDEDALIARAKNRKINVNVFMLNAGFEPVAEDGQLEITEAQEEEPLKRKRRTKEEIG